MKVVIFGASGLVGGNMHAYFVSKGWDVLATHFSYATPKTVPFNTLDLESNSTIDIEGFQPDVIINCGALTWVDYCEEHPEESYQKTVQSTINTLKIAENTGAKYLYIGTDYIFDGTSGPYTENETPNPVNVYGQHKLEAENIVLNASKSNLSLRITNVYGDELRNKNFVSRLIENIKLGEPQDLKLPVDQFATPINALDIARAAYLLLSDSKSGVYNIASTNFVNRVQLAQLILSQFPEHKMNLIPVTTKELNPPANRPLTGGLITAKFLSEYPTFEFSTVQDYVAKKV